MLRIIIAQLQLKPQTEENDERKSRFAHVITPTLSLLPSPVIPTLPLSLADPKDCIKQAKNDKQSSSLIPLLFPSSGGAGVVKGRGMYLLLVI